MTTLEDMLNKAMFGMAILFGIIAVIFYFVDVPLLYAVNSTASQSLIAHGIQISLLGVVCLLIYIFIIPIIRKKANAYADKLEESIKNEAVK